LANYLIQSDSGILHDLAIGDSGSRWCLPHRDGGVAPGFIAAASPETLRRTTLGQLQMDDGCQLRNVVAGWQQARRSFRDGSCGRHRLSAQETATSWEMSLLPDAIARYIVSKGSIAINGVSLTVADYDSALSWFKVSVIPQLMLRQICYLRPGSLVNLEGDILGKYIEKITLFWIPQQFHR